jgi:hypothetical protein
MAMDIEQIAEQEGCREASRIEGELLQFLGENPGRWEGATAILLSIVGVQQAMEEEQGVRDPVANRALVGFAMMHLAAHIVRTPAGAAAVESVARYFDE